MGSLAELKAKLAENWCGLDMNRDGRFDIKDVLGYDRDGDGKLDREELEVVTKQLASQMEYNNLLLEHLQALEESHLEAQREMKKKEHALKLSLSVSNAARAEANDMRRKWAVASEVAETMTKKCEEAKLEVERRQREVEAQRRLVEEAREIYEATMQQKSAIEDRLARTEHDLEMMRNDYARQKSLDTARITDLERTVTDLNDSLQKLRDTYVPLTSEHKRVTQVNIQLENEIEEANNRLLNESRERENGENRIRELENSLMKLKENQKELNFYLKEEQAKVAHLECELAAFTEIKNKSEEELQARETWLAELKKEYKETVEENKALKNELEQVANELLSQARQRGQEQERWAKKLAKAQEQLATVTEEARIQAQRYALETQKRCAENMAMRKECEEQYIQLQAEHAELHDLLKDVHNEHKERLENFEEERAEYNKRIHDVEDKLQATETASEERERELLEVIEKLKEEVKAVRNEMNTRGGRYVQMLTTVQQAVKALCTEGSACRDEISEIAADFQTFQRCVKTFASNQGPPLEAWFNEVQSGMDALVEQNKNLQKDMEDQQDCLKEKEVKVEELKAEILRQQAEASSLKHEVVETEDRLMKEKRGCDEKVRIAQQETDAVRREKEDIERRMRRIQDTLDFANSQNKKLQEQSQVLAKQVADIQAQQAANQKKLEAQIASLEGERKSLDRTRLELLHEREGLLRSQAEDEHEKLVLQEKIRELEAVVNRQETDMKAMEIRAQKKLSETNLVLNHSVRQLESTQKLLQVMRQGKAEAQEEKEEDNQQQLNKWQQQLRGDGPQGMEAVVNNPKAA